MLLAGPFRILEAKFNGMTVGARSFFRTATSGGEQAGAVYASLAGQFAGEPLAMVEYESMSQDSACGSVGRQPRPERRQHD